MCATNRAAAQHLPRFLDFDRPALDSFALAAYRNAEIFVLHALSVLQEIVTGHTARIGPVCWHEFQHGQQKCSNLLAFLAREMVLLVQDVR
jgi:hypothetical protein